MSRQEDGAAVVIAVGLVALLMFVGAVGCGIAAIVATHRRVQSAADLAVLAGAAAAQSGRPPCAAVERIAVRNGGEVRSCDFDGSVVVAVVGRRLPMVLGGQLVRARARAGPVAGSGSSLSGCCR